MNIFFAVLFIILNFLDVSTTRKILALGGSELNPIAWILQKIYLFIPVKIIVTLVIASFIVVSKNIYSSLFLCSIISLVVINNYYQIYLYEKCLQN